jgi:hypothetical protein
MTSQRVFFEWMERLRRSIDTNDEHIGVAHKTVKGGE